DYYCAIGHNSGVFF
nr:immunoglobulin light chain junction region [Macaca mulatta]MOX78413.1 immunoglobulin light chain junction region [Macaca mulatta]MOX79139.1 immunoglobulin light chain junction region [Macaca mulatta]MOX80225.1 immunoglobulin light chain junction region [Macaca mulatta]MOX83247.1 immunoglobulin light chain junction region [Macaca mulatta]